MKIGRTNEAHKVAAVLANVLKIERNSLCFCGIGKKFKSCCGSGHSDNLLFIERALDTAEAYRKSQGGQIRTVPGGIWKGFEKASLRRLPCLYPGCSERPVNCHLIPENILRSRFGGHCKEYRMDDESGMRFIRVGIGNAACLPVFCSKHDHALFNEIDRLGQDPLSDEQSFLLALKAVAFSLRKTQYLLGIDSQVEIARPFLMQGRVQGSHVTLDVSHFHEQYIRFTSTYDFLKKTIDAHSSKRWDFFYHFHQSTRHNGSIFFSGLINPSHDLSGHKINISDEAIAMACNIFTIDGQLRVLLSCPEGRSTKAYSELLKQLISTDEKTFITILNNLLTASVETLLLPEAFSSSLDDLQRIATAQQRAASSLKADNLIFDLKNSSQAVKFI